MLGSKSEGNFDWLHSKLHSCCFFRFFCGVEVGMGLILIKQYRSNNRWEGVMTTARQEKEKKKRKELLAPHTGECRRGKLHWTDDWVASYWERSLLHLHFHPGVGGVTRGICSFFHCWCQLFFFSFFFSFNQHLRSVSSAGVAQRCSYVQGVRNYTH